MGRIRWGELGEVIKQCSLTLLGLLGLVGTPIAFWLWFGFKGLGCIFFLYACVAVYWAYHYRVRARPYYILEGEEAMAEATKMLKAAKRSLYYYGGAGFIGKHPQWKQAYQEKLDAEQFKIYRFLDAKPATTIKTMVEEMMPSLAEEDSKEYAEWLITHSSYLRERGKNNLFYDFEGAPIWKYGLHFIIFDERHVVIAFLSTARTRTAILIPDNPEMAASLSGYLTFLRDNVFANGRPGRRLANAVDLDTLAELPEIGQNKQ